MTEYEEAEEGENGVRLYDIWKIGFLTVIRKSNFRIERSTKTEGVVEDLVDEGRWLLDVSQVT